MYFSSHHQEIGATVTKHHMDRISTLPDDIISNKILSLLPTKDSVRTSALSNRWKHLYASVPVLNFQSESRHPRHLDPAFAGFVSNVLNTVINKLSHISRLYIGLEHVFVHDSDIISWIETATSHSVQTLDVTSRSVRTNNVGSRSLRKPVYGIQHRCAPYLYSLFTCETLVSLSLDIPFDLCVPDVVCLPNLKNLWLKGFEFRDEPDDESVKRLFSGCPILESLMLSPISDYNGRVFDVSVPSLKVLGLFMYNFSDIELSINCPNLEKLECTSYAARGYSGDVLGSLKICEINPMLYKLERLQQGKLIELVRQVCKVQLLSLVGDSMHSLLIPTGSLPTFENLTHLKLDPDNLIGWRLLPSILDSSPRLEILDFPRGFSDKDVYFGNPNSPPEHVPYCLLFHLKVIKIGKFTGVEPEYKWVEYFLTNALVLEKMEIRLPEQKISKRLLSYKRSSEVCQIVLLPFIETSTRPFSRMQG